MWFIIQVPLRLLQACQISPTVFRISCYSFFNGLAFFPLRLLRASPRSDVLQLRICIIEEPIVLLSITFSFDFYLNENWVFVNGIASGAIFFQQWRLWQELTESITPTRSIGTGSLEFNWKRLINTFLSSLVKKLYRNLNNQHRRNNQHHLLYMPDASIIEAFRCANATKIFNYIATF